MAAMAGGAANRAAIGNGTLNAQSSGLANRSSGRSKLKIPNGLGSEFFSLEDREFGLGDEGAISPLRPSRTELAAPVCAILVIAP